MDLYEERLIDAINQLEHARTPMERTRRLVLIRLLNEYRNEKKNNLE